MSSGAEPVVAAFHDPVTATLTYLVSDPDSDASAIVDPVLDYDAAAARTSTKSADAVIAAASGRKVQWLLETHAHADHLTAAPYLKSKLGGQIAIGSRIADIQSTWKAILNLEAEFAPDGSQFDRLLRDGDHIAIGGLDLEVWNTPGHTPGCMTYVVRGRSGPACAFVGDTLFMPDYGTARTDFPGGDARVLYRSIRRIFSLPPDTRLFTAHDYLPGGRPLAFESTVADQRRSNKHIHDGVSEDEFCAFRVARDRTLSAPNLLLPSIQVNIRAGRLPPAEANGTVYLKIPVNRL